MPAQSVRSLTNVESRKPSRRRWHFTWVLKREWVSSRKRRAFREEATTEVKAWGYEKLWQLWKIEGCYILSHRMLKVQGRRPLFSRGFLQRWSLVETVKAPYSCSQALLCPTGAPTAERSSQGCRHSHPLPTRLGGWHPRRKEAGEEADKKDSFCLDTNILVISTDGMRNTKKSTWQFRENLAKCYIFLTYLYRVFGTSTWISQSLIGPGGYASTKWCFDFRNVSFPIHKSILVMIFFFSHQNKVQDLSLTLCLLIWTASCVTYFYPAWSFLADSWGHVLVASELSLDLSKVLMGFLAFFKLLISIFFLLPSSPKRKIYVIHQQLSILLKCSAEGLVFLFARIALPCHGLQNKPHPDIISSALLSPLGKGPTRWLIHAALLVRLLFFKFVRRQVGVVVRAKAAGSGDLVLKLGSALSSWLTFGAYLPFLGPSFFMYKMEMIMPFSGLLRRLERTPVEYLLSSTEGLLGKWDNNS